MREADEIAELDVVFPDGRTEIGTLTGWEESSSKEGAVELELLFGGRRICESEQENFFDALVEIRRRLEQEKIFLRCYGASLNVYPSSMIRDMGPCLKAYRMKMGQPALNTDLVSIFDSGPDVAPATVEAQKEFFEAWSNGFRMTSRP